MLRVALLLLPAASAQTCDKKVGEEYPPADEEQWIQEVTGNNVKAATAQLPKEVVRGAHGKTHGCARARWETMLNVPASLDHGVFQRGKHYDAWVRFSNGAGNTKEGDDRDPDVRGFAVKLLGVDSRPGDRPSRPAERGIELRETTTQDFIFISSERNAFITRVVKDYIDPGVGPKLFGECPTCGAAAADLNSHYKIANPLNITYGSLVNYVLDSGSSKAGMKYYVTPCDMSRTVPSTARTNGNSTVNRNFIRDALSEQLEPTSGTEVCMEFGVQMQADACAQPMEDASVPWDVPRVPVAKIHFPLQRVANANQLAMCENLAFNPWHTLNVHRPAGGVSRARLDIYFRGSGQRYKLNGGGSAHVNPTSTCLRNITDTLEADPARCPFMKMRMNK